MSSGIRKPLLESNGVAAEDEAYLDKSLKGLPVTQYAKVGFFGKATFRWLNSVLEEGYKKPITKDDIPLLAKEHRAVALYNVFEAKWPKERESNGVVKTLARTFWKQFLIECSSLNVLRLCVMFVGPVLIQSFVTVAAGEEAFPFEGYVLVLVLFVAKILEILSIHLFQFNCQKLAVQVRSVLISSLYRKGLKLSSFSRQSHGVGQIVNYMSTDVQQISDAIFQLNNIWLIPCQLIVALVILFFVTGVAAIAGLAIMCFSSVTTYLETKRLQNFQRKVMDGRDERMLVTIESLSNMKIVKLQAWDKKFFDRVAAARAEEYKALSGYMYTTAINMFSLWFTPLMATVAIFACSFFLGRSLSASMAFTTIATVKIIQQPLRLFTQCLIAVSQAAVSLQRLDAYLGSGELEENSVSRVPSQAQSSNLAISVEEATFKWGAELEDPALHDINLEVRPGSLVAVVGRVGMGKSSLLAALLGEMAKVKGKVEISGSTAYVSQQAWIQSGTIQDNILFGQPMHKGRYQSALNNCALKTDLAQMEFGDQTEIGERGLNLSGGQKQRIQLARAVYQDCDVYLLDDIFSAVDAHTASDLFKDCIVGALASKTVVLVTHQIDFLRGADLIVVMKDGRVVQSGHYQDLLGAGTDFESLVEAQNEAFDKVIPHEQPPGGQDKPDASAVEFFKSSSFQYRSSSLVRSNSTNHGDPFMFGTSPPPTMNFEGTEFPDEQDFERRLEKKFSKKRSIPHVQPVVEEEAGQLVREEERETGSVGWKVYWLYITRAYNGWLLVILLLVQAVWQVFQIGSDYWVAYGATPTGEETQQTVRFVYVYAILAVITGLTVLIRSVLSAFWGLKTTQSFFTEMLQSLFRAPMSFFDTTPTGRILSRATTDQAAVDVQVSIWLTGVMAFGFQLLGIIFVTLRITWEVVFLVIPLGIAYLNYQNYYFATARELTRVDAITKANVTSHFEETIYGFVTIRSFNQQDRFNQINVDRIDSNLRIDFHNQAATEWVGLRMEFLGVVMLCTSSLLIVGLPKGWIDQELVGLCLTYGMNLNASLFILSWMYCQLENKMVSVERIGQYSNLPKEAELSIEKTRPAPSWPTAGYIELQRLKLRYRPQTPLVLKGITLKITGGRKVGVVGRTGSGKSTLILALFRLVEPDEGRVLIDGVDISPLGLNDLRSRLSIIPQDPTLFDGTVRSNLDPLGTHSDPEIWDALEKCQLASNVKQLPEKLDAPVLEGGENWSLGQRQLFCLGRVILKRSRILVLDEATASVDAETDSLMQSIIRREFEDSTVISIAHRIPTVMDSDRVLVLDAGRVQEYGSPSALLDNPKSLFSSLVKEYSARSVSYSDLVTEGSEETEE